MVSPGHRPEPQVRYYDTRPPRSGWTVVVAILLVVAGGAAAAWFGSRLLDAGGTDDAGELGTSGLPVDGDGEVIAPRTEDGSAVSVEAVDTSAGSLVMVGDSITQGSTDAIRYTLAASGLVDVTIDGVTSRRIEVGDGRGEFPESGIRAIYRLLQAGADPDVWVVALGTNDIGKYDDPQGYRTLVRTVAEMIPEDAPLVWVDAFRGDYVDESRVFDEALRDELDGRDDTVVVSWSDIASTPGQTVLRDDDVHPNKDGNAVFARLVADGVAAVT